MLTTVIKYEKFFLEKVYHCPFLKNAIEEIFKTEIQCYSEIILAVSECCKCDPNVYCLRVQEKSNCLFLCQAHLIIMLSEAKFDCISMDETDLVFNALQKHYCKSCVRHYCEKLCNIYQFKFFNLVFSKKK